MVAASPPPPTLIAAISLSAAVRIADVDDEAKEAPEEEEAVEEAEPGV